MAKIAISLPDEVLQAIEMARKVMGQSRSEFFRRAAQAFLRHERQREAIEQYIQGYLQHPETQEELGWVDTSSQEVLEEYPWRDEAKE